MKDIQETLNSAVNKFLQEDVIVPISTVSSRDRARLANLYKYIQEKFGEEFTVRFNQNSIVIIPGNEDVNTQNFTYSGQPEDGVIFESQYQKDYWTKHIAGLIKFMKDRGVKLDPLPEIILKKQKQTNGLLDKTGSYDKDNKVIEIYTEGRHVKDCIRSAAHELIHHSQNLEGKLTEVTGEEITGNDRLKELEEEATLKGYTLFREYTESLPK